MGRHHYVRPTFSSWDTGTQRRRRRRRLDILHPEYTLPRLIGRTKSIYDDHTLHLAFSFWNGTPCGSLLLNEANSPHMRLPHDERVSYGCLIYSPGVGAMRNRSSSAKAWCSSFDIICSVQRPMVASRTGPEGFLDSSCQCVSRLHPRFSDIHRVWSRSTWTATAA